MPNKKRWEYAIEFRGGMLSDPFASKKEAKRHMITGDKLKRRFVGKWRDA